MNDRVILGEKEVDLQEFKEKMVYDNTNTLVTHTEAADRKQKGAKLKSIEIEDYGSPTNDTMHKIKDLIQKRFDINNIVLFQRVGKFEPGEEVSGVLISSPDRGEAFEALALSLDMFETHVPIRKRIATVDGREYWIKRADEVMDMYGQVVGDI